MADLNARMPHGCDGAAAVEQLQKRYEGRSVRVVRVAEAWAIRTAPDLGFLLQKETVETRKLSRGASSQYRSLYPAPAVNHCPS